MRSLVEQVTFAVFNHDTLLMGSFQIVGYMYVTCKDVGG